jgi:hypothetical protein
LPTTCCNATCGGRRDVVALFTDLACARSILETKQEWRQGLAGFAGRRAGFAVAASELVGAVAARQLAHGST